MKKKESLAFGKPRGRNNRNTVTKYVKYDDVECLQKQISFEYLFICSLFFESTIILNSLNTGIDIQYGGAQGSVDEEVS